MKCPGEAENEYVVSGSDLGCTGDKLPLAVAEESGESKLARQFQVFHCGTCYF